LVEANLRSKLRPVGPAGAKVTNRQAPFKRNGPRRAGRSVFGTCLAVAFIVRQRRLLPGRQR
jgi:hypothetical protein